MAKSNTVFVCSNCGNESSKWFGKCPACNEWNTCYEEKVNLKPGGKQSNKKTATPTKLNDVKKQDIIRTKTGFEELDRVLGGGLVKGSLTLLGGEPGIGKSTLILQICDKIKGEGQVLYVSGEESIDQIKLRADRLNIKNVKISNDTHIWNLVYINNKWLNLDVTWDDPVNDLNRDMLLHEYFLKTREEFNKIDSLNPKNKHVYDEAIYNFID